MSWPNAIGTYQGNSAELRWTISEDVKSDWNGVDLFYHTTSMCTWIPSADYLVCSPSYENRIAVNVAVGSPLISLNLTGIQADTDVKYNYTCKITLPGSASILNSKGWIIVYGM